MKRRIYTICIVLGFVVFSLLMSRNQVLALTPTLSPTMTSTAYPGAEFSGTPLTGNMPLTVQFTHLNANFISSCVWTFGDGTSLTASPASGQTVSVCPSVTHTYTAAGSYTVKLTVTKATNGFSSSITKTNYIVVTDPTVPTNTATFTPRPGCGTVVVVTSTPSPTRTPTPRVATATTTPSCGPIYITATPGTVVAGPDLVISSINYVGSNPTCANILKANVVVTNLGNVAAGTFFVSVNGALTQINGLGAGQSTTLVVSAAMSITATADSTNLVAETNESNNTLAVNIPLPSQSATCTPTGGPSLTPTRTPTPTLTPTLGTGACSPVTSTITAPFTFDGAGSFCWKSSNLGTYINSWNTTSVTINGVNISNLYVASGSYPAQIGGFWYVRYTSSVAWGHFEAK